MLCDTLFVVVNVPFLFRFACDVLSHILIIVNLGGSRYSAVPYLLPTALGGRAVSELCGLEGVCCCGPSGVASTTPPLHLLLTALAPSVSR